MWPFPARNRELSNIENLVRNQPREAHDLEIKLREQAKQLPDEARRALYEIFSTARPSFAATNFRQDGEFLIAKQRGQEIAFPSPTPIVIMSHIIFGYEGWLAAKYSFPGFVEVDPGDVVIDCGAYVGGFSLSATKHASQIHAFEPDRTNFKAMERNFSGVSNIVLNCCGLYSETRQMTLNVSNSNVEHSLLTPDDGSIAETRKIEVVALADYLKSRNISRVDFAKIEAEGVELEVFEGLRDIRPRKLAIDVAPERDGESPAAEFERILTAEGYAIKQRQNVLFARR